MGAMWGSNKQLSVNQVPRQRSPFLGTTTVWVCVHQGLTYRPEGPAHGSPSPARPAPWAVGDTVGGSRNGGGPGRGRPRNHLYSGTLRAHTGEHPGLCQVKETRICPSRVCSVGETVPKYGRRKRTCSKHSKLLQYSFKYRVFLEPTLRRGASCVDV